MSGERPILGGFNLVVNDMDAAVAFYRLLGLDIPDRDPAWDEHHRSVTMPNGTDFDLDSATFARQWDRGWHGGMGVVASPVSSRDAVDQLYAELTGAGYAGQQEPYDAFWGARYAIVEDSDGNAVGLMSPIDASRRSAPPAP